MKPVLFLLLAVLVTSCIEDFAFKSESVVDAIVIEAEISNLSYADLAGLPMDARYFTVKVKRASAVKAVQDTLLSGAEVTVSNDLDEHWDYVESTPGEYVLYYSSFRAEPDRLYRLTVHVPGIALVQSGWQSLPTGVGMGSITFSEEEREEYKKIEGDLNIIEKRGFTLGMGLDDNRADVDTYLRWDFYTTWIYRSRKIELNEPNSRCWNTTEQYLKEYVLREDKGKGAKETELFFVETDLNEKLAQGFSVLIRQSSLSREYYQFWEDLQKQKEQSELFAPPPYSISSNFGVVEGKAQVYGYFGVVHESFDRWYYDEDLLSYYRKRFQFCLDPPPDTPPPKYHERCFDCTKKLYDGKVTTSPPWWWKN